jgi:hypothetical protein
MLKQDLAHHAANGTGTSMKRKRTVKSLKEELRQVKEKLTEAEGIIDMLAEGAAASSDTDAS